jgi:CheY-like chemotaxis protein
VKNIKIVHIDDEERNRDLFKLIIKRINKATQDATITIETFASGEEFLESYEANKFEEISILFTDWSMPLMDGGEVISRVRSLNRMLHIWIVSALTSNPEIPKVCLTHNCMTLPKPVRVKEISIIIKQFMSERDLSVIWNDLELLK